MGREPWVKFLNGFVAGGVADPVGALFVFVPVVANDAVGLHPSKLVASGGRRGGGAVLHFQRNHLTRQSESVKIMFSDIFIH